MAVWVAGSTASLSCGFENPGSIALARGSLNWAFPDSLHVGTAVWEAQLAGVLARDETPAAAKALLGYHRVANRLNAFRNGLAAARPAEDVPAISMVLLGPVLWTRFVPGATSVEIATHATGPEPGDVVIVTDVAVISAIATARLTPREARALGLLRLYGTGDAVERVSIWLDRWTPGTGELARVE